METPHDQHSEYRRSSLGGALYLAVEGGIWLASASLGANGQITFAILALVIGGMFIHPIVVVVSRFLRLPQIPETNRLPILNTWLALIIPIGLPLVYLAMSGGRTNLFYPALSILIGAHWLPFIYIYAMKSFALFAAVFVAIGIVFGFFLTSSFSPCGFVVGLFLFLFASVNLYLVRREVRQLS